MMNGMTNPFAGLKASTMDFFKPVGADGARAWNRNAIIAVVVGGLVGWFIITATIGGKLKRVFKKIPVLGSFLMTKTRAGAQRVRRAVRRKK